MDSGKLEREMDYMRRFFKQWTARYGSEGPLGALATWLGADPLELHGFETALATYGVNARADWFVKQRCDLILAYFASRLHALAEPNSVSGEEHSEPPSSVPVDHVPTQRDAPALGAFGEESAVAISLARRLLHVGGEDLVRYRPREVADLLAPEVDGYAARPYAAADAEAHFVNVQAALDLGYDWCLRLARPALRKALDTVRERIERERHYSPEIASRIAERSDLGTLTLLAERQTHSLGELY